MLAKITHAETLHITLTDEQLLEAIRLYLVDENPGHDTKHYEHLNTGNWNVTSVKRTDGVNFRESTGGYVSWLGTEVRLVSKGGVA